MKFEKCVSVCCHLFLSMVVLLALSGCVQCPPELASNQAWLKPGVSVTLPAPGISPAFETQQLLTANYHGQQQSLLVMLQADEQQLTLVGLSSLGVRLFKLTYNSNGVHTEQSIVVPQAPPASQVLADIMLGHWPLTAWQPLLPQGWMLSDEGSRRLLRDDMGTVITEIDYAEKAGARWPVRIRQYAFEYEIDIEDIGEGL